MSDQETAEHEVIETDVKEDVVVKEEESPKKEKLKALPKVSKSLHMIPLADIVASDNPRSPAPNLSKGLAETFPVEEGKVPMTVLEFCREYGISKDAEKRAEFCKVIEQYETGSQDIVILAKSRASHAISPIVLRQVNGQYQIVIGERRYIAAVYNYARGEEKPYIEAEIAHINKDQGFRLAVEENLNRMDMNELEKGEIFHRFKKMVNPDTEKKYTLYEIAALFHQEYAYVRGREALVYLTDSDKIRLLDGRLGLTKAIEMGSQLKGGKKTEKAPDKKSMRATVLPLAKVRELWNNPPETTPKFKEGWQAALATVMKTTVAKATKEAEAMAKQEERKAADQEKAKQSKTKKPKAKK